MTDRQTNERTLVIEEWLSRQKMILFRYVKYFLLFSSTTEMLPADPSGWVGGCSPQCILPSDPGYVLYSAIGSFFAPMMVMIFFNWRIYRVASKTTRAIRRGFTKVKGENGGGGGEGSMMGIHR